MEKQVDDGRGNYADVIQQLADVLQANAVPYEVAASMFGMMTKMMVDKAINDGTDVKVALNQYVGQFMAGMGGHAMITTSDDSDAGSTFVPPGHLLQ